MSTRLSIRDAGASPLARTQGAWEQVNQLRRKKTRLTHPTWLLFCCHYGNGVQRKDVAHPTGLPRWYARVNLHIATSLNEINPLHFG